MGISSSQISPRISIIHPNMGRDVNSNDNSEIVSKDNNTPRIGETKPMTAQEKVQELKKIYDSSKGNKLDFG